LSDYLSEEDRVFLYRPIGCEPRYLLRPTVCRHVQYASTARRGISWQMTFDDRLGPIQADERKIRQVVLNLLSNAIKFTPEGGRIEVRAVPVDGSVEVSVSDTGVGIATEDQEAVFEEFRQVGTSEKKAEGTGLGLTLCRKFIELHGGRIWVRSQVGVGSTFTFTIPVHYGNENQR
jgi:signal transduction histidine kinase